MKPEVTLRFKPLDSDLKERLKKNKEEFIKRTDRAIYRRLIELGTDSEALRAKIIHILDRIESQ